ncbi:phosphohistidine phosphatase [Ectothiorhodospira haloalkaliphila]|uniref:Phosphohistidine phosphatase n=2 Tax=Ectothiorhodospira haloalkaliphila TaxID=421628 RepID=W8KJ81_9GAMM|nr:phosphohistidine phosphatase [Ectothiorhodospira haloalkaliphila]
MRDRVNGHHRGETPSTMEQTFGLILVRHAQAGDAVEFARTGQPDDLRPLTEQGVERMHRAAQGLARLLKGPTTLLSSPYTRARQTANILAEYLPTTGPLEIHQSLVPEAHPGSLDDALQRKRAGRTLTLVGHEPHLSCLVGWLVAGRPVSLVRMKKGGACYLHFDGPPQAGRAILHWLLTQRHLRLI